MATSQSIEERFWAKVNRNGPTPQHCPELGACWVWTGSLNADGYGMVRVGGRDGKTHRAHRLSWSLNVAPVSTDKPHVLHRCDNPPCVNPKHLWVGTNADNMRDRNEKRRQAFGARHGSRTHPECLSRGDNHNFRLHPERVARGERSAGARLTEAQVRLIRIRAAAGEIKRLIAADFGVARTTISEIARGAKWKHVQ